MTRVTASDVVLARREMEMRAGTGTWNASRARVEEGVRAIPNLVWQKVQAWSRVRGAKRE